MPYSALSEPMLAKSGKLPTRGAWAYEVKWDGFRAIVSTEGPLWVRSRRGWNTTEHVRFLEALPVQAVLDGELVALGEDGSRLRARLRAVCEPQIEGVVCKRVNEPYLCGERAWVKVKNRDYWRYELERGGAFRSEERSGYEKLVRPPAEAAPA